MAFSCRMGREMFSEESHGVALSFEIHLFIAISDSFVNNIIERGYSYIKRLCA